MSLYWIAFLIVMIFSLFDFDSIKLVLKAHTQTGGGIRLLRLNSLPWFIMTVLMSLRYMQGTDYIGHWKEFNEVVSALDFTEIIQNRHNIHFELGWMLLNRILYNFGISFEVLILIISFAEMLLIRRFMKRYCPRFENVCLCVIFPAFYYYYCISFVRQGLVMCIFMGAMFQLYEEKKYLKYIFLTLLCITIHQVALVYFVFLILGYLSRLNIGNFLLYPCIICFFLGILLFKTGIDTYVYMRIPFIIACHFDVQMSYGAVLYRLFWIVLISYMCNRVEMEAFSKKLYFIYLSSIMLFFFFSGYTMFVNRAFSMYTYVLEFYFISKYLDEKKEEGRLKTNILKAVLPIVMAVILIKNMNGSIVQMSYGDGISFINYPYISVFDKDDYRDLTGRVHP